ncbi:MAG: hypothetical protein WAS05_07175 [Candidatus Nanopelagicales bacterium]
MSSDGTKLTAAWAEEESNFGDPGAIKSRSATITSDTATWGSVTTLSEPGIQSTGPKVTVSDNDSRAVALWSQEGGPQQAQVGSATISRNVANWGGPIYVSHGLSPVMNMDGMETSLTLSADGIQAAASWTYTDSSLIKTAVATGTINGTSSAWGAGTIMAADNPFSAVPSLSGSADGRTITAVWMEASSDLSCIGVGTRTASVQATKAAWNAPTTLASGFQVDSYPEVAQSSDGKRAIALFKNPTPSVMKMQASVTTITSSSQPTTKRKSQQLKAGATPKRIKKRGVTFLNKRNARTKQGIAVSARARVILNRGELRCAKIIKGKQRKLSIRTYGNCTFRIKVTYTAKGNSTYLPLKVTKTYRVKR